MSYTALLTKTMTRWQTPTNDGFGGLGYASRGTILGRWQNKNENFIDEQGNEFISAAIIYTTEQLALGDWMYEGTSVNTNPQDTNGAYRVRLIYTTESPDGSIVVYKAILGG